MPKAVQQHDLERWSDFASTIAGIREQYGTIRRDLPDGTTRESSNRILFRGQADHSWELETTLERRTDEQFNIAGYLEIATRCVNEIESFTGKRWNVKDFPEIQEEITHAYNSDLVRLPCYDYLVYLRHHGFPSPLLDWTESPFVAAYFAFCEATRAPRAAVYAFIETETGGRMLCGGDPDIKVMGPYVSTHARHFSQKAWYTVATIEDKERGAHYFCPHSKVFDLETQGQDILIAVTIPTSERQAALHDLNDYNINHFTLFQTEDSLVKAMAMKVFDLNG